MAEQKIAPDIISDVAEWGDRKIEHKLFADMTSEELADAKKIAAQLGPLPHQLREQRPEPEAD